MSATKPTKVNANKVTKTTQQTEDQKVRDIIICRDLTREEQTIYKSLDETGKSNFLNSKLEKEVKSVVGAVRRGRTDWLILESCLGYSTNAINEAIKRGLIVDVNGDLYLLIPATLNMPSPSTPAIAGVASPAISTSRNALEAQGSISVAEVAPRQAPATEAKSSASNTANLHLDNTISYLDKQIADSKLSIDPAIRLHGQMLENCTKGDWLDQVVKEVEMEATNTTQLPVSKYPSFTGLELKNEASAHLYGYLVYTGDRQHCVDAWLQCCGLRIVSSTKANGKTGSWKLVVSLSENKQELLKVAA